MFAFCIFRYDKHTYIHIYAIYIFLPVLLYVTTTFGMKLLLKLEVLKTEVFVWETFTYSVITYYLITL